jgi:hypothetical protein
MAHLMTYGFTPLFAAHPLHRTMLTPMRPWGVAVWFSVIAAFAGVPALAADAPNGSRNFRPPPTVPNYFSNEAGPILGGQAETRRGELYPDPNRPPPPTLPGPERRGRTHFATVIHGRVHYVAPPHHGGPVGPRHFVAGPKVTPHAAGHVTPHVVSHVAVHVAPHAAAHAVPHAGPVNRTALPARAIHKRG